MGRIQYRVWISPDTMTTYHHEAHYLQQIIIHMIIDNMWLCASTDVEEMDSSSLKKPQHAPPSPWSRPRPKGRHSRLVLASRHLQICRFRSPCKAVAQVSKRT